MSSIFRGIVLCLVAAAQLSDVMAFLDPSSTTWRSVRQSHGFQTSLFDTFQKDSFDMDELRQRIRAEQTKPFSDVIGWKHSSVSPTLQKVETVYIVSFPKQRGGLPCGVHSIEYPKGSGNNVILAFASKDACDKFAETLRAQHFFDPTPQEMSLEALVDLCMRVGVSMQLIPHGVDLIPPKENVPQLGRSLPPRTREQLNAAYYLLDSADDWEEEGVLWGYAPPDSNMEMGVFD